MFDPALIVRKAWVVGQIRAACSLHEAFVNRIPISADDDELFVLRGVRGGRNYTFELWAGPFPYMTELVVLREGGLHHIEDSFVDRNVDDLALSAVDVPMIDGGHSS